MLLLAVVPACVTSARASDTPGVADHAVILQYHHVSDTTPQSTSLSPALFSEHLAWLAENGFHVWSLADVVAGLRGDGALPDSCVALTFDDAYSSVYSEAWPLVRQYGWSMTVFVPTKAVDNRGAGYMSWEQIRELAAAGVTIASHGHAHDYLARRRPFEDDAAWHARVRQDIELSLRRLEEELGRRPDLFAWPYGESVPAIEALIDELGLTGFGQQSGPVWRGSDFGALPRFPMAAGFALMAQFPVKVASLPLPVVSLSPRTASVPGDVRLPELRIELDEGDYVASSLSAYCGTQGRIELYPVEGQSGTFVVKAISPLPRGRSRYNITASATGGGRFFWFSKPWLKLGEESRE